MVKSIESKSFLERMSHWKLPNSNSLILLIVITLIFALSINRLTGILSIFSHAQSMSVSITGLHVSGNQILNDQGQTVRLLGVDRSGTEYECLYGYIFDGPSDQASITAMKNWQINVVRIPLNEDCWLGINGVPAASSGTAYQQGIINYVNLLNQNGIAAILDLHWSAPGTSQSTGQEPMPDEDHSPAFWTSVANTFKTNSSVLFDLYNEPYPDNNTYDSTAAWTCWRDGGICSGVSFPVAGMQQLVNAIRTTGASNIIMIGGIAYSSSLKEWLTYKPTDSDNNLAASWHNYDFSYCNSQSCWNSDVAPVAAVVPLIAGEIGEDDCADTYINPLMNWLDSKNASYLGWAWDTYDCSSFPSLISDYSGTPTNFGLGFEEHLDSLTGVTPLPTPTPSLTPIPTITPTPPPPANTSYSIYNGKTSKLLTGWSDCSWSSPPKYNNTTPVLSGETYSIRDAIPQYQAFSLCSSFQDGAYGNLEFWVQAGGSSAAFNVEVDGQTSNSPVGASAYIVGGDTSFVPGKWEHVIIPLSALQAVNQNVSRVYFYGEVSQDYPTLYFSDISFTPSNTITTPTPTPPTTPYLLYDSQTGSLANGYDDWSWTQPVESTIYSNTSPIHSGNYSVKAIIPPWDAFGMTNSGTGNTDNYKAFDFWVQSAGSGNTFSVNINYADGSSGSGDPTKYIIGVDTSLVTGKWEHVTIPLSSLSGCNKIISSLTFYGSGNNLSSPPPLYFDTISLTPGVDSGCSLVTPAPTQLAPTPTFTPTPTPTLLPTATPKPTPVPTSTPTPAAMIGDLNGDGKVDLLDLSILLSNWGQTNAAIASNFRNPGTVGIQDLSIFLSYWNP